MIGVVGDTNAGKSTLLNALIGQKVLPSSYKSCTSAIVNVTLSDREVPQLAVAKGSTWERVDGRKEVLTRIKTLNEEIREDPNASVVDLCLSCRGSEGLVKAGVTDSNLRLVDMPGHNETDNPIVKDCLDELLSRCHGLIILVKHDGIKSDSLAALFERIATQAPHVFASPGACVIGITQVDNLRCDDDEDDEGEGMIKDLKAELRQFMHNRECLHLFPGFADDVPIVATSVGRNNVGSHEFGKLTKLVHGLHESRDDLKCARRLRLSEKIFCMFSDMLNNSRPSYPARASQVREAAERRQSLNNAILAISAASFIVTLPLGGWGIAAGCVFRLGGAAACLAVGVGGLAAKATDAADLAVDSEVTSPTLGGARLVGGGQLGAIGAEEANKLVKFEATGESIDAGVLYQDTLLTKEGGPLYIGSFKENLPEGPGRLFWPGTNYEAFIGTFKAGLPFDGAYINEKGFFVACVRQAETGNLVLSGTQADDDGAPSLGAPSPPETLESFLK